MKQLVVVLLFFGCSSFYLQTLDRNYADIPVRGYKLVWNDEFSGIKLNKLKWNHRGLGKRGDAFNTKSAVTLIKRGHLVIEAYLKGDSILTGMISTDNTFKVKYGYFECKAKLTKSKGIWPAFWLQSLTNGDYSNPHTNGIEIDIFEYFLKEWKDSVHHALHWGGYGATHKVAGPVRGALQKGDANGLHTFGLEWTPNSYTTYVDGVKTYTYKATDLISKVPQFLILSLHVDKLVAGPLNIDELPDKYIVDYVRVYKKANLL